MSITALLLFLVLAGLLLWLVPMEATIKELAKKLVIVVAVVWAVFWLFGIFGLPVPLRRLP